MKTFSKKQDNRGFSLVELIIVIAIMAILVGIVGTQVIPYLNRSREAKDLQVINSYSTAAVSTYSIYVETVGGVTTFNVYDNTLSGAAKTFADGVIELTGYADAAALQGAMSSSVGQTVTNVRIDVNTTDGTITATAVGGSGDILEPVVSTIGSESAPSTT